MNCENAVCVVTGAGSGLGNAVSMELLRRGAKVAALDLMPCSDFEWPLSTLRWFKTDVTDETSVKSAIACAVDIFGAINVCINCASYP
jgi:NAD(P)-dependent dehydrogenase (short-subunit alcohol dehydrogenase family)